MRTTIVIPTYNERENLRPLMERIAALRVPDVEVLIVDDNSPDGTGEEADALAQEYAACVGAAPRLPRAESKGGRPREREVMPPVYPHPQTRAGTRPRPYDAPKLRIRVLHRRQKEGLGAALTAGFHDALAHGAEIVVQMDADGSHDPAVIPEMLSPLSHTPTPSNSPSGRGGETNADLVVGSRRVPGGRIVGWGMHRRLASWGAQWIGRRLLGFRTRDITSGLRAWRTATLRAALSDGTPARGYAFQERMFYRAEAAGARIVEHPITFRDRVYGVSKLGRKDVVEFFRVMRTIRRRDGALPHPDGILTWGRLPHPERRFTLRIAAALVFLAALPYVLFLLRTPPGYTYTGLHAHGMGDTPVYVSYINQVQDGAIFLTDQFTAEQPPRRFLNLFWLGAGWFARITHLPAILAFHALRLLLIVPFTAFLAVFVASFFRRPIAGWSVMTVRKTALVFLAFASGIGAYIAAPLAPYAYEINGYYHWPLDLWAAESVTFLTLLQSPHFIASLWCILAGVLFLLRFRQTGRWRWAVALGVLDAAFIQFHPFYAPLTVALPIGWTVALIITERRIPWRMLGASGIALLGTAVAAGYHLILMVNDPVAATHAQQNILQTPAWWLVLISYGFLMPLAALGIVRTFRNFDPPAQLLVVWIVVTTFLTFSNISFERRFTEGLHVVLVLLAMLGLFPLLPWLRNHLARSMLRIAWSRAMAIVCFVLLFTPSNIVALLRDGSLSIVRFPTEVPRHALYFPDAQIAAMEWLGSRIASDASVLGLDLAGPFLPMYCRCTTVVGHSVETKDYDRKVRAVYTIADGTMPADDALTFLREQRTRYIIVTDDDRQSWIRRPDVLPGVRLAFRNAEAEVYEIGGQ